MAHRLLRLGLRGCGQHRIRKAIEAHHEFDQRISGFGVFPFLYQSAPKPSAAADAIAQSLGTSGVSGASGTNEAKADLTATALTGFTIAPKLSAGVIDALLKHQTLQSADTASSATDPTTNLSGASATSGQTGASSGSQGPKTLQQIAGQFDPHNLTHQQE